jgi:hypothetical protein
MVIGLQCKNVYLITVTCKIGLIMWQIKVFLLDLIPVECCQRILYIHPLDGDIIPALFPEYFQCSR